MNSSSWFSRFACAVIVVALGGCPDQFDDLGPDDDVVGVRGDAGQSVDPVVVPAEHKDANVDPVVVVDAGKSPHDASAEEEDAHTEHDAGAPDSGAVADGGSEMVDASSSSDAGSAVSFASVYAIITTSCTGCHGAGKTLDLSTPELAISGMVGVEARYAACAGDGGTGGTRVIAGNPDGSLLIQKLEGTQTCGKQMPPKALLAADQIALFRAWIAAGASAQ